MKHKENKILEELKEHIPFTALATLISVFIASLILIKPEFLNYTIPLFEFFHPAHILFSTIVSAAIFYNYRKNIPIAIISAILISLIIGSLSDIIFPYLGSLLFQIPISFHLPVLEEPLLIFGVAIVGAGAGIIFRRTKFPHFLHVFISIFASLLYIFAYSTNFSWLTILLIFIITTLSVTVPCCIGDIILPIVFSKKENDNKRNKH